MDKENERNDEPNVERRNVTTEVEVRKHEDDETHVEGYAALFNSDSVLLPGGFIETLEPNAFTDVLEKETTDPVALFNHNPDYILGRRSSGTLRLYEDNKGLRYSIRMPSSAARVIEAVQRRDVIGSSFAFTVSPNDETFERGEDGIPRRRIRRVSSLLDVAVVVSPAYPSTSAAVRMRAADFLNIENEPQVDEAPAKAGPVVSRFASKAGNVANWLRRV